MNIFIAYCSPLSWYFPSHGCCVLPWCPIFPGFAPISDGSVYKLIIYREQGWEYRSTIYRAIDNCIVFTISWSMESSIKSIDNIFLKCFCVFFRRKSHYLRPKTHIFGSLGTPDPPSPPYFGTIHQKEKVVIKFLNQVVTEAKDIVSKTQNIDRSRSHWEKNRIAQVGREASCSLIINWLWQ